MYNFSFFGQILSCKHFYCITGFCDKKLNFCKFANFFADSKSRAQELSNDVSFVIFWHQTWDLGGGGGSNWPPPQHILVFKCPSRDGVKVKWVCVCTVQGVEVKLHNCYVPCSLDYLNNLSIAVVFKLQSLMSSTLRGREPPDAVSFR